MVDTSDSKSVMSVRAVSLVLCLASLSYITPQNYNGTSNKYRTSCTPLNDNEGICVPLKNCNSMKKQLQKQTRDQAEYIVRRYGCGFRMGIPFICCPVKTKNKTLEIFKRTEKGVSTTPKPEVKSRYRNRRLLPENSCGLALEEKIIGGMTSGIREHPWLALLQYTFPTGAKTFGCGGALISARYVLTAAHCIKHDGPLKLTGVRLGEFDTSKDHDCQGSVCSDPPQDIAVQKLIMHPNYNPELPAQYNDIALIRLQRNVVFSEFVSPICLPLDDVAKKNYTGIWLTVVGWGRLKNERNTQSTEKQKLEVPVVSLEKCAPFYRVNNVKLRRSQICAGGEENKDSCAGDSGGPLMSANIVDGLVRWHVTGIVSFGPTMCGLKDVYAVYTNVASFTKWILETIIE